MNPRGLNDLAKMAPKKKLPTMRQILAYCGAWHRGWGLYNKGTADAYIAGYKAGLRRGLRS